MNINVVGGPLYQWDVNRQVEITDVNSNIYELHFSYKFDECSIVVKPKTISGKIVCDIPNEHLQRHGVLFCYVVNCSGGCVDTVDKIDLTVIEKGKPTEYVYTPSEVVSYSAIVNRVLILENYMKNNPTGQRGPQGPKGDTGPQGPKGDTGPQGESPQVDIDELAGNVKGLLPHEQWSFELEDGSTITKEVILYG